MFNRILLVSLSFAAVACTRPELPVCAPADGLDSNLVRLLEAAETNGFRGAVAISADTTDFYWATADYDPHTTRFWIGSIAKPITAIAAVRLSQQGQIQLNRDVRDVFGINSLDEIGAVTLESLLAHRSGLGGGYPADGLVSRDRAVAAVLANGLEHSRFFYSNKGYNLAAAMMEQLTGEDFEALIQSEVFEPAGMRHSGFWGDAELPGDFARPEGSPIGERQRNYGWLGSTGLYSTAGDLMLLLQKVRDDDFLNLEGRSALWEPRWQRTENEPPATGQSYGLGWGVTVVEGRVTRVEHGGYDTGLNNGRVIIDFEHELEVVVLAERAGPLEETWSTFLANAVIECVASTEGTITGR